MSRKEWEKIIEEFNNSGKSQAQWCRDNNLKIKAFNFWYRKLKGSSMIENNKSENQINWMPVKLKSTIPSKLNIKMGKAVIEIENGYDEKLLVSVIKTLEAIC